VNLSRRRFLQGVAALAAATGMPWEWAEAVLAAEPTGTSLDRTIARVPGGGYRTLTPRPGEPRIAHPNNPLPLPAAAGSTAPERVVLAFAHFTDVHIIDAQSPARVEFLDRFATDACDPVPFDAAFRPSETLTTQVQSAMVRAVNDVQARRIAAGELPLAFAVSTGDNCDNQQANELEWFIAAMDGTESLNPNSGGAGYEGVQAPTWGDRAYWLPRADIDDDYKVRGFPGEDAWGFAPDGFLAAALVPFAAPPLAMPWYAAYGNHDGLLQGNMPANGVFQGIAVGALKVAGPPPAINPCDSFAALLADPTSLLLAPANVVTPDPARRILSRQQYVDRLVGHGITRAHADAGTAYYATDDISGFRLIILDTVNPGGYAEGSIGQTQLDWLADQLRTAGDRWVLLFSHHSLHSLTNPVATPDPLAPVIERRVLADEIEALVHTCPNVVGWIAGHTHINRVTRFQGAGHTLWSVETAAHVDWPAQARIVEIVESGDTIVLRLTIVDHAGPVTRDEVLAERDPVLKLAGIHRELAANDPQHDYASALGPAEARNVELTVRAPFPFRGTVPAPRPASPVQPTMPGGPLPATGSGPAAAVAGALALAGAAALRHAGTAAQPSSAYVTKSGCDGTTRTVNP
jgi:metallophosphoesterase (TIGR03767 family)